MQKTIDAMSLLTAKQLAQLDAFNASNSKQQSVMAVRTAGAAGKVFKQVVTDIAVDDLFEQFERAKHANVIMFTRYVNTLTGSWTESGKLPTCPSRVDDFLKYRDILWSWVMGTTNNKTSLSRAKLYSELRPILDRAYDLIDAARAARAATDKATDNEASKAKQPA